MCKCMKGGEMNKNGEDLRSRKEKEGENNERLRKMEKE